MELSKTWFGQIRQTTTRDKGGTAYKRVEEECAKKTFLVYIQAVLARDEVEKRHAQQKRNRAN